MGPLVDVSELVAHFNPLLSAAAIAMGRPAGAALALPVFTRAQLSGSIRATIAFALALGAMPAISESLAAAPITAPLLVLIGTKEIFVGLLIGVLLGLPIWSVQCAGELLDTQRSATQGSESEPESGNQDSNTAAFLGMTVSTLFVISGGLVALADTINGSYEVWPALRLLPLPTTGWIDFLLGLLDHLTRVSLSLAAPVVMGMLLCETCVILLMRAVPKLQLYDLAPTLRNLAFALLMFAYADYLVVYMHGEIGRLHDAAAGLRALLR